MRLPQIIGDEAAQVIGIISRIHDDMTNTLQAFDQTARLRAVAPLAGRDRGSDRQAERIHRSVDFGG